MSEDLSWTEKPPRILNPEEAEEAGRILSRKPGEPRGHEKLADLKQAHREELSPSPSGLDPDLSWFFPGLAYCLMGMDRSLFELFSHGMGKPVPVTTYRADSPLVDFQSVDVSGNPWFYTLQGIPQDQGPGFSDYIQTFQFNDRANYVSWELTVAEIRLADPFRSESTRTGVDCSVLLPACSNGRRVVLSQLPGLALNRPCLAIVSGENP